MNYRILHLEDLATQASEYLSKQKDCEMISDPDEYDPSSIDAIIVRGKRGVTMEMMERMTSLKVISRCGVGVDNVDVTFATLRGILVTNTPGVNADTVAEHTIGLMLMLQRKMYKAVSEVKANNWAYRVAYNGDEIRGKTLGVLGMGDIGMKVARLAESFGMKIQYSSRSKKVCSYSFISQDELATSSDIISIHLPLSEETRHTINAHFLSKMKDSALIINTARGPIVDELALLKALNAGKIGGYGGDFPRFDNPDKKAELLSQDNVLITPHSSSLTERTFEALCRQAVDNTLSFLRMGTVDARYRVN